MPQFGWTQILTQIVSSVLKQREENVFLCARTCRHGEWRFVLHSEREVKPSGGSGAEPFGGIQKNLHICWKLSSAHAALTPVPPHLSHFALLWVSNLYSLLIQKKKKSSILDIIFKSSTQIQVRVLCRGDWQTIPRDSSKSKAQNCQCRNLPGGGLCDGHQRKGDMFFTLRRNHTLFKQFWTPFSSLSALIVLQHVLLGLQFSELSWDHSYPEEEGDSHILWLEFDGEEDGTAVNKLLKIYSKQVRKFISQPVYAGL